MSFKVGSRLWTSFLMIHYLIKKKNNRFVATSNVLIFYLLNERFCFIKK